MATIEVPINYKLPAQVFNINLNKQRFILRVYFNTRSENWFFDLLKDYGTPIFSGNIVLPAWIPLRQYTSDLIPLGQFVIVDSGGSNTPPGRLELGPGRRVSMVFVEDE